MTLHMCHAVMFLVTPMLTLSDCSTAVYAGQSGTSELIFGFAVPAGDKRVSIWGRGSTGEATPHCAEFLPANEIFSAGHSPRSLR